MELRKKTFPQVVEGAYKVLYKGVLYLKREIEETGFVIREK